jgi:hypothetical protein
MEAHLNSEQWEPQEGAPLAEDRHQLYAVPDKMMVVSPGELSFYAVAEAARNRFIERDGHRFENKPVMVYEDGEWFLKDIN